MTDAEIDVLKRENHYLKQRVHQLEGDVADLAAEGQRLLQTLDRIGARRQGAAPNPLSGGQ